MSQVFDAVVIGAGHAGIEATRALSAMGKSVGLLTFDENKIGAMSCNPAIGGVAKSHLVKEIDALGGLMGMVADSAAIQARRLNMNKGPAVRSTRLQCDKDRYVRSMIAEVRSLPGVSILSVEAASIDKLACANASSGDEWAVRTKCGLSIIARAIIVTTGTFMRGLMFCGDDRQAGGRVGDKASSSLSESIENFGHLLTRLKTGTPARLKASTINFSKLERQWGDPELRRFSWREPKEKLPQLCCYVTYTNERTHEIIQANFDKSPLFSGEIVGTGPRYCPSIEDKVRRFSDRNRHQIFLEPEGIDSDSIYPNGMSTSLPKETQLEFLRSIAGLENVELLRPGYAVEYDSIDPTTLRANLMSKFADGIFFAGQVNRTSGYEEAAAQGLWAGIGAAQYLSNRDAIVPQRSRSYIETLVDDLTTKGSAEPYRMFTSRSEYRLVLREDNAHSRLYMLADSLGLISDEQKTAFELLNIEIESGRQYLEGHRIRVGPDRVISMMEYLKRPSIRWEELSLPGIAHISDRSIESLEVEAKYDGYLSRQEAEISSLDKMANWFIDPKFKVEDVPSLSAEIIEKFNAKKPKTVKELAGISGISPTALILIAKHAGRVRNVPRETVS